MPHQKFRGGDAYDDDRLNELNHRKGNLIKDLQAAAADEQYGHQHGNDHGRDGVVAGEERDQDPGKSIALEKGLG
jgi:hypothetical protein